MAVENSLMIEIMPDDGFDFDCARFSGIIEEALLITAAMLKRNGAVAVRITDNIGIRQINMDFRGIDAATDVLSFPATDNDSDCSDGFLGDIAISFERAVEQARAYGHSIERETAFLTVHGMLHILGLDHITPNGEAEMLALQKEILNKMGLEQ